MLRVASEIVELEDLTDTRWLAVPLNVRRAFWPEARVTTFAPAAASRRARRRA